MSFDFGRWSAPRRALLDEALDGSVPPAGALEEAMRYSLLAGGKRIRPLLCLAGAEAVGGQAGAVLPTACALEMIHTFSLIHDDLPALDNDDLRRGRPTCHIRFGEATAILAGDALHTLAFETIARRQSGPPERLLRVVRQLAEACRAMVAGQVDDLGAEGRSDIAAEALRSIHARKTGALLTASLLSGAILGGADEAQEAALETYGRQIGIAFQIIDDILDVTGDDATLGKPAGSDLRHDKATYPKLFGLERSRQMAREAMAAALDAIAPFGAAADPLDAFARFLVERDA